MSRVYNFSAGPSMLPEEVLQQAAQELPDWQKTGMSVMEMSHRGKQFLSIAEQLEADLRELMAIPDNYKVLFLQGGASAQFSMLPLNLLDDKNKACYVNTGAWSAKAIKDAQRYCNVVVSASAEISRFTEIPAQQSWVVDSGAAYMHYTINETIHGVEFFDIPDSHGLPLVTDMSSNILSRPIDVSCFGVIYAGSQKNMGPAGVTVVIVRDDLLGKASKLTPDIFNYTEQAKNDSMINTPPTHSWYMVGLILQWLKRQGGLHAIEQRNIAKARKLYKAIDDSKLFHNPVHPACRSRMNVPFILADAELDKPFLKLAEEQGLTTLAGHRSVGGMRASIYNAMPEAGIDALIEFMAEFERTH